MKPQKHLPEPVYKPIHTPLGILQGRDAIHIDGLHYDPQAGGQLRIVGQIDGSAVTDNSEGRDWYGFTLVFEDVQALTLTQVDTYGYAGGSVSSFDQVFHSRWRNELINKNSTTVTGRHTHYHLRTYDDVLDILSESFALVLDSEKRK
ncbi:hypothetical protein G4Y79_22320 [Phototrophicus methaneseepsis]|uniref:Uncharacterized protein n=1 Tax=Phototrophicus methaneseepsis TaxID=2710758 RepID=A0A7S8E8M3_9CHLR|nr:hypothetical protein [Phototrophicus methaneseepsis]QPC82387.1 hypothetical protein G4Y79_22320 [Phototrophicus methaneseepsis]